MANITRIRAAPGIMVSVGRYTLVAAYQDVDLELLSDDTILGMQEEYEAERINFEDYATFKDAYDLVKCGCGGGGTTPNPTVISELDPTYRIVTTSGTITSNPNSVTFYARIGGTTFPNNGNGRIEEGQSVTFSASQNNLLNDIDYVIDALGELSIIEVVDSVPDVGIVNQDTLFTVVTTNGVVASGASSVTFYAKTGGAEFPNNGGGRIEEGQSLTFSASINNVLKAITYEIDALGELSIIEVRDE